MKKNRKNIILFTLTTLLSSTYTSTQHTIRNSFVSSINNAKFGILNRAFKTNLGNLVLRKSKALQKKAIGAASYSFSQFCDPNNTYEGHVIRQNLACTIEDTLTSTSDNPSPFSPSQVTLLAADENKLENIQKYFLSLDSKKQKSEILYIMDKVLKKEQKYHGKGYYVLNHGQKHKIFNNLKVCSELYILNESIKQNKFYPQKNNRIKIKINTTDNLPESRSPLSLLSSLFWGPTSNTQKISVAKKKKQMKGTKLDWKHRDIFLSCNPTVTGNWKTEKGESTFGFVARNCNAFRKIPSSIRSNNYIQTLSFLKNNQPLAHQLDKLATEYNQNNNTGLWWQLIFKNKEEFEKHTYASKAFGKKASDYTQQHSDPRSWRINDLVKNKKLRDTVDEFQFRALCYEGEGEILDLNNPNVKFNVVAADQKKLVRFNDELYAIISQFKKELEQ